MYTFSPKLKTASIILILVGLVMFGVGYALNTTKDAHYIEEQMKASPEEFSYLLKENHEGDHVIQEEHHAVKEEAHEGGISHEVEHLLQQYHNKPWTALLISVFMFTGIAAITMFFLAVQHVSQSGWSVILTRIMEAMTAFLPYGTVLMLIVLVGSALHFNHLYHWMNDPEALNFNSPEFDPYMKTKEVWLNIPFWLSRSVIYLVGWTLFAFWLRAKSKKLDQTKSRKDYWSLYRVSVYSIIFFGLSSMASGWDWVMSIDPHWYSTLFGWYVMISYLVAATSIMILIAVYLKNKGVFPQFNDNHLHDLTKYLFGFSLLWGYLWLCQFELIWFANIPEETVYFKQRDVLYSSTYYGMLIINVVIPFLALISSSIKRNYQWVTVIAVLVILGHWLDFFNQMMPTTVGPWWQFGLLEFGAFFFVAGLFTYVVMNALSKSKLIPEGNPLLHESEIYEYPF